jgi:transcriptional regulator with XRE-family HTH domain
MKTSEIFRIKLKKDLKKKGKGAQSKLAKKIGLGVKHLNDFLGQRAPLSEEKREVIAQELGFTYIEYLQEAIFDKIQTNNYKQNSDPPELAAAIDDLRAIYESKDSMLIGAIKSNLVEFRRAAEDRKNHQSDMDQMKKEMAAIKKQMDMDRQPKPKPEARCKLPVETVYERRNAEDRRKPKNT